MSTQWEVSLSDTRLTDDELVDWLIAASAMYALADALHANPERLDNHWLLLDRVQHLLLDRLAVSREAAR